MHCLVLAADRDWFHPAEQFDCSQLQAQLPITALPLAAAGVHTMMCNSFGCLLHETCIIQHGEL
jgi:hypothetical protein